MKLVKGDKVFLTASGPFDTGIVVAIDYPQEIRVMWDNDPLGCVEFAQPYYPAELTKL